MIIRVDIGDGYDVVIDNGALDRIDEFLDLDRKVLLVTDDGVPEQYSAAVERHCAECVKVCLKQGEESKNFDNFRHLLETMLDNGFTRSSCVVAVGGGVVGDIAAFCASCYMRGIDFYNIPTTLLSQVDSSIGGKTAIDLSGVKNVVGSFYQPRAVVIDPLVLKTLPRRQLLSGLVESIKMALTSSAELFELIKNSSNLEADLPVIIEKSLEIKRDVVEKDTRELGLRRVLNFGHTVGHAIESADGGLLHGECVGIGMRYFSSEEVKKELDEVLKKYSLPLSSSAKIEDIERYLRHDKKASDDGINVITVDKAGSFRFSKKSVEEIIKGVRV